ncbi:permease [bacterium]|nr:permease [bacterium]
MLIPIIIMAVLAVGMVVLGLIRGQGEHVTGLKSAWTMTLQVLPLLLLAFVVAGMIQALLPQHLISRWVGAESGFKGILIGTVAGALTPGGPYVSLPVVAGFIRAGAGVGTMVAFITGWSLWAVNRIPMEIGILGWKFTVIRFVSTLVFPPVAGLIAQWLFSGVKI